MEVAKRKSKRIKIIPNRDYAKLTTSVWNKWAITPRENKAGKKRPQVEETEGVSDESEPLNPMKSTTSTKSTKSTKSNKRRKTIRKTGALPCFNDIKIGDCVNVTYTDDEDMQMTGKVQVIQKTSRKKWKIRWLYNRDDLLGKWIPISGQVAVESRLDEVDLNFTDYCYSDHIQANFPTCHVLDKLDDDFLPKFAVNIQELRIYPLAGMRPSLTQDFIAGKALSLPPLGIFEIFGIEINKDNDNDNDNDDNNDNDNDNDNDDNEEEDNDDNKDEDNDNDNDDDNNEDNHAECYTDNDNDSDNDNEVDDTKTAPVTNKYGKRCNNTMENKAKDSEFCLSVVSDTYNDDNKYGENAPDIKNSLENYIDSLDNDEDNNEEEDNEENKDNEDNFGGWRPQTTEIKTENKASKRHVNDFRDAMCSQDALFFYTKWGKKQLKFVMRQLGFVAQKNTSERSLLLRHLLRIYFLGADYKQGKPVLQLSLLPLDVKPYLYCEQTVEQDCCHLCMRDDLCADPKHVVKFSSDLPGIPFNWWDSSHIICEICYHKIMNVAAFLKTIIRYKKHVSSQLDLQRENKKIRFESGPKEAEETGNYILYAYNRIITAKKEKSAHNY